MKSNKRECCAKSANDNVYIDTSSIPQHIKDSLAMATLDFIRDLLRQSDGREALNAKKAELLFNQNK